MEWKEDVVLGIEGTPRGQYRSVAVHALPEKQISETIRAINPGPLLLRPARAHTMLYADKQALETDLKVCLLAIRERELSFYTQNCRAIGTSAPLMCTSPMCVALA